MADTKWTIKGREFVNCNCSYGERGHHGSTTLDGLKFV